MVTGGAGFIGSELVRQLAGRGFGVRIVDNLANGRRENINGVLNENVEFVEADVRDVKAMTTLMRDIEVVFHLACLGVRHSIHSPMENHEVNATATRIIRLPRRVKEILTPIPYVIPAQIFAACLATQKGLDPDKPRTLSKVTLNL